MGKTLKVLAILLVVTAVIFEAGCAEKTNTAENESQAASGQVTPASVVTPEETPASAVTPEETNENITENTTENTTENNTAQTVTHISNTVRKRQIAMNHTVSSGTKILKQESD